jgi:hypothetical protein
MKQILQKILWVMASCLVSGSVIANPGDFGQTIQIYTYLKKMTGKPTWLLIIRDVDNGQNIPYLYDFDRLDNFWLAFTYGRNYLILASRLVFNPLINKKVSNFCGLESDGRIIRGESLSITVTGKLTTNPDTYTCTVQRFPDANFNVGSH